MVTGTGLASVTEAYLGVQLAHHRVLDTTRLELWVPRGAVTGTLRLRAATGLVRSAKPFVVIHGAPVIKDFLPASAWVGEPVLIRGNDLQDLEAVRFGGVRAGRVLSATPLEVRVQVPAGAASGPIEVETPGGTGRSATGFRVADGPLGGRTAIRFEGAYVTQGVQKMDGSVPLVAGRDGCLRVFLRADAANTAAPAVRARLLDRDGAAVLTADIPAPHPGAPTEIHEEIPKNSWNLPIPGRLLKPGLALKLEIPPGAGDAEVDIPERSFPPGGRPEILDVVHAVPLHITLIPIRSGDRVGRVEDADRTRSSWLEAILQYYPVAADQVDLQVGPVFESPEPLGADKAAYARLLDALEAEHLLAHAADRFWYGVFPEEVNAPLNGIGLVGHPYDDRGRTAIGYDGETGSPAGQNYSNVMAHELGHNLGRRHAPCGVAALLDPQYPYRHGRIEAQGFDVAKGEPRDPGTYTDIMGYCEPRWPSDYTYLGLLASFLVSGEARQPNGSGERRPAERAADASGKPASLLVWGRIRGEGITWEPSFTDPQGAGRPEPGPYTLECVDPHGRALMPPMPFALETVADLPTRLPDRPFAFLIPMTPAMQARPFTLHIRHHGHRLAETAPLIAAGGRRAAPPREPVARLWRAAGELGPGQEPVVHLGWDAGAWPGVVVRDPRSHAILAIATGGSVEVETTAEELDCQFSLAPTAHGERSQMRRVKVGP